VTVPDPAKSPYLAAFAAAVEYWLELENTSPLMIPRAMSGRVVMYLDGRPVSAGMIVNAFSNCPYALPAGIKNRSSVFVDFSQYETYAELALILQIVVGRLSQMMLSYLAEWEPSAGGELH
jgi:hypothetical protein